MSTHPALQPRLDRSNVTMMLKYIAADRDAARARAIQCCDAEDYFTAALLNDYADGLARAHEIVTDMWAAAVIYTDALADELAAALDDMTDDIAALDDEEVEDDD